MTETIEFPDIDTQQPQEALSPSEIEEHVLQLNDLLSSVQRVWKPLSIVDVENGTDMAIHLAVLAGMCLALDDNTDQIEQHSLLFQTGAELVWEMEKLRTNMEMSAEEASDMPISSNIEATDQGAAQL